MNLEKKANWLRNQLLDTVYESKHGHIGGALSCVEILISLFYGGTFRLGYDRFILSKGHACVALYPILEDLDYFEKPELKSFCKDGALLGGHPDRRIPGIEINSGSLGHGLGIGCGFALADKLDKIDRRTYVLMGDGECQEGSVWEAVMFASRLKLNNLIAIVDKNGQEVNDFIDDKIEDRFVGWTMWQINGHNLQELQYTFEDMGESNSPHGFIASTIKGKGISFMEGQLKFHHTIPTEEEYKRAKFELNGVPKWILGMPYFPQFMT